VHDHVETPLGGSSDVFMHKESPSLGFDNNVIPNPLDHSHVFPMCSSPSLSPKYYIDVPIDNPKICYCNVDLGYENNVINVLGGNVHDYVSLGYLRGYDPSIDPYCVCLGDLLSKIICTTFFNPSYNFSKAFDKVKRILVVFSVILVIASYLLFSELWSQEFDKLLLALKTSNFVSRVLTT